MQKRKLHHIWRGFRHVKPRYFLALAIVSGVICLFAMRSNNEHMVKLRAAVYSADKNNGDIAGTLANLQKYVTSNMNTNLSSGASSVYPPIQLKYTYNRLVAQQSQEIAAENSEIYNQAENYCQIEIPTGFSGRYRVPCIEQYVSSHTLKQPSVDQSLYQFDFISPTWSPDLAGWSLIVTIVFGLLFIFSFIADWWIKKFLS